MKNTKANLFMENNQNTPMQSAQTVPEEDKKYRMKCMKHKHGEVRNFRLQKDCRKFWKYNSVNWHTKQLSPSMFWIKSRN